MTKEQLLELGLTEEQITEVFKLNGLAVENAKSGLADVETELNSVKAENETLKTQIKTANKQIEEFNDIDVEDLEAKIQEYKDKFEQSEKKRENQIKELEFKQQITNKVMETKPYNVEDVMSRLKMENIVNTENGILGLKEELERIKTEYPHYYPEVKDDSGLVGSDINKPDVNSLGDKPTYDDILASLTVE